MHRLDSVVLSIMLSLAPSATILDFILFEPAQEKPKIRLVRKAKTPISLRIRAVWWESSLIAWTFYSPQAIQTGINVYPCHTGWMYRLIWVFASHTSLTVGFVECGSFGYIAAAPAHDKTYKMACAPSENRSAWASAQSDRSFRCPHEQSLGP